MISSPNGARRRAGLLTCAIGTGLMAALTAHGQPADLATLAPVGEQTAGLWLTDYRPGDPLFFDLDSVRFKPWAEGLFNTRQAHDLEPHARCKASGNIRQFLTPYGVEIVEIPALKRLYIFDIGGPHTFREVFMDGRGHPTDPVPSNYGHNIGWWEGNTLIVDSVGYNEDSWFERYGLPYTDSVQVTEFFTRLAPDRVAYRFVIDDPATYEAPVEGRLDLYWQDGEELFEFVCQQSNYAHELMVNPENLRAIGRTSDIVP